MTARVAWWPEERRALAPPERLTVATWADRYRVLGKLSAEPGRWSTERTPYLREILDAFTADGVEQITLCTSTQIGKTEALLNLLLYTIDQDPGPMLFVHAREADARRILRRRIKEAVEESPRVARNRTKSAADWGATEVSFTRGAALFMGWAASPASLAGNPCRFAFGDEVDKWPRWSGREASPVDLMRERLHTFRELARIVLASTPTTRGGMIWQQFQRSDQRRFWLPCPHCGRFQVLRFERIRWGDCRDPDEIRERDLARYHCEHCDGEIADSDKPAMLARGAWVPEGSSVDDATGEVVHPAGYVQRSNRGYHLWAAYSPWITFSRIAAKWVDAHESGDPAALMNVVNSWLAELWERKAAEPKPEQLAACVSDYRRDELPNDVRVIVAGADVQKIGAPYAVYGFGAEQRCWLLREGHAADIERLVELILAREWVNEERSLRCRLLAIDARAKRGEVLDFARSYEQTVRPVLGVESRSPIPYYTTPQRKHPETGRPIPNGQLIWSVNVGLFKDEVAAAIESGAGPHARAFHVHSETTDAWRAQLLSEHKVLEQTLRGLQRERWVVKPGHRANHAWDCTVYAYFAAQLLGVHLVTREWLADRDKRRRRRRRRSLFEGGGEDDEPPRRTRRR